MCSSSSSAAESCRDGGPEGGVAAVGSGSACSKGAGADDGKEGDKVSSKSLGWSVAVVGISVSSEASPLCPNGSAGSVVLVGAAVDEEASVGSANVKVFVAMICSIVARSCSDQVVRSTDAKSCLRISSLACGWFDDKSCSVCALAAFTAFCFARSSSCSLALMSLIMVVASCKVFSCCR